MQKRILRYSGVLNMLQAIVLDGDGLWNKYACDKVVEEKGFEVHHFDDDMVFRHFYESEYRLDPKKKRILVIDENSFIVPYDIGKQLHAVDVSLHGVFPILNEEALREIPGLDYDHLASVMDSFPYQIMDKRQTYELCLQGIHSGFYAVDFGCEQLDWAASQVEHAVSYRDWIPVAKAFGKASMIQHSGIMLDGYCEKRQKIENAFTQWIHEKYSMLSGIADTRRPVLLSKVNDLIRKGNQKIALIVMDGMSFENYYTIRRMLAVESFQYDEEGSFSFFPTVTAVARQSVFSGKLPREHEKPFSLENEEKQWKAYWKGYGFRENEIGYFKTEEPTVSEQMKVVGIVINVCDDLMHDELQGLMGLRQGLENWIRNRHLVNLLGGLLQKGFAVYMTADHGNTSAIAEGRFKKPGVLAEPASRRAVIYQSYADAIELGNFNVVKYDGTYLPTGYTPYLFSDGVCYGEKGKEYITHGGMTLEETIVPFIRIGVANG